MRANVVYFDDLLSATVAGFRPCKRCAPDDVSANAERERLMASACALLDYTQTPSFAVLAARLGISRFHFARLFRMATGLTPGEYLDARRRDRLRDELALGASVAEATEHAGYGSASRMYERRVLGMTPTAFRRRGTGERLQYVLADFSLGRVLVARTTSGICAIDVETDEDPSAGESLVEGLRRRFAVAHIECAPSNEFAHRVSASIRDVDVPPPSAFPFDLHLRLFRDRLWLSLRKRVE